MVLVGNLAMAAECGEGDPVEDPIPSFSMGVTVSH